MTFGGNVRNIVCVAPMFPTCREFAVISAKGPHSFLVLRGETYKGYKFTPQTE